VTRLQGRGEGAQNRAPGRKSMTNVRSAHHPGSTEGPHKKKKGTGKNAIKMQTKKREKRASEAGRGIEKEIMREASPPLLKISCKINVYNLEPTSGTSESRMKEGKGFWARGTQKERGRRGRAYSASKAETKFPFYWSNALNFCQGEDSPVLATKKGGIGKRKVRQMGWKSRDERHSQQDVKRPVFRCGWKLLGERKNQGG